jgi:hypothetical protein
MSGFDDFFDDVILIGVSSESDTPSQLKRVSELCREVDPKVTGEVISAVAEKIRHLNFGKLIRDNELPAVFYWEPNANARSHASKVEFGRRPTSFSDRLASDKVNRIGTLAIAFLSLVISVGALVVAYLALKKSS